MSREEHITETKEELWDQRSAMRQRLEQVQRELNETKLERDKWQWAWRELARLPMQYARRWD